MRFLCWFCAYKPNSVPILPTEGGAKSSTLSEVKGFPSQNSGRSILYLPTVDKIGDNYLSSPSIALGVKRHCRLSTPSVSLLTLGVFIGNHGLAPSKDLAVSSPLFCPYGGARPTSLGWGLPSAFASGRHCSHLASRDGRVLPATFFDPATTSQMLAGKWCSDFPPATTSQMLAGSYPTQNLI